MIEVVEVPRTDAGIDYIWNTLGTSYIQRSLSDQDRSPAAMFYRIRSWLEGADHYYIPIWNGEPMGLCYATYFNDHQIEGHISIFKRFWGQRAMEAAKLSLEKVKAEQGYEQVIFLLPETNRLIHAFTERLGYKKTAIVRGLFTKDGVDIPCSLMEAR